MGRPVAPYPGIGPLEINYLARAAETGSLRQITRRTVKII